MRRGRPLPARRRWGTGVSLRHPPSLEARPPPPNPIPAEGPRAEAAEQPRGAGLSPLPHSGLRIRVSPLLGPGGGSEGSAGGGEPRSLPAGEEGVLWASGQGSFHYRRRSEGKSKKIKILVGQGESPHGLTEPSRVDGPRLK